jgi:hypothetical protein
MQHLFFHLIPEVSETGTISADWANMSRYQFKMETESSLHLVKYLTLCWMIKRLILESNTVECTSSSVT